MQESLSETVGGFFDLMLAGFFLILLTPFFIIGLFAFIRWVVTQAGLNKLGVSRTGMRTFQGEIAGRRYLLRRNMGQWFVVFGDPGARRSKSMVLCGDPALDNVKRVRGTAGSALAFLTPEVREVLGSFVRHGHLLWIEVNRDAVTLALNKVESCTAPNLRRFVEAAEWDLNLWARAETETLAPVRERILETLAPEVRTDDDRERFAALIPRASVGLTLAVAHVLGTEEALRRLVPLSGHPHAHVRREALEVLEGMEGERVTAVFERALDDRDASVLRVVVRGLASRSSGTLGTQLLAHLRASSRSDTERMVLASALVHVDWSSGVEDWLLETARMALHVDLRLLCLQLLGDLGSAEVLERLPRLELLGSPKVSNERRVAVARLRQRHLGARPSPAGQLELADAPETGELSMAAEGELSMGAEGR